MSTYDEQIALVERGMREANATLAAFQQLVTPAPAPQQTPPPPPPNPKDLVREMPLSIIQNPYSAPFVQQHSPYAHTPAQPAAVPPMPVQPPQQQHAPSAHPMGAAFTQAQQATSFNPMYAYNSRQNPGFPDPQYLTPAATGVYRPEFHGPPEFATVPRPPSILRSMGIERGWIPSNTWETPMDQRIDGARDRVSAEIGVASGTGRFLAETVGAAGGWMLGAAMTPFAGWAGGIPGAIAGAGVGGMAYDAVTDPFMAQYRRGREMSMASRGTVTTGPLARAGGDGMTTRAGLDLTRELDGMAADSHLFNRADMDKITQLGFEKGLVGNSADVETMARGVKHLSEQIKLVMKIAGDPDIQNVMDQMGQLSRFGVKTTDMSDTFMQLKGAARVTGKSIQELMETSGAQGGFIYNQMGLGTGRGFAHGIHAETSVRHAANSGLFTAGQWQQMGGQSGAAQRQVQALAANEVFMQQLMPAMMGVNESGGLMVDQNRVDDILRTGDIGSALRNTNAFKGPGGRDRLIDFHQNQGAWNEEFASKRSPEEHQRLFQLMIMEQARAVTGNRDGRLNQRDLRLGMSAMGLTAEADQNAIMPWFDQNALQAQAQQRQFSENEDFMLRREQARMSNRWRSRVGRSISHAGNEAREGMFGSVSRWFADREERLEDEATGVFRRDAAFQGTQVTERDLERMFGGQDPTISRGGTGRIEADDPDRYKRFLRTTGLRGGDHAAGYLRSNAAMVRKAQEMGFEDSTQALSRAGFSRQDVAKRRRQLTRQLSRSPSATVGLQNIIDEEHLPALLAQALHFDEEGSMFGANVELLERFGRLDEGDFVASTADELEQEMERAVGDVSMFGSTSAYTKKQRDLFQVLAHLNEDERAYALEHLDLEGSKLYKGGGGDPSKGNTAEAGRVIKKLRNARRSDLDIVSRSTRHDWDAINKVSGKQLASDLLNKFEVNDFNALRRELGVEGGGINEVYAAAEERGFTPGKGSVEYLLSEGKRAQDGDIADQVEPFARGAEMFTHGVESFNEGVRMFVGHVGGGGGSGGASLPSRQANSTGKVPIDLGQRAR